MTFREQVHPERADKLWRFFMSKLNRELAGPRWHKKPDQQVYWLRGLEYQKRGVIHYHALAGHHSKDLNQYVMRMYWSDVWNQLAGFSRIEAVRSFENVAAYVSKYVVKGGQIDASPYLHRMNGGGALTEGLTLI